MGAQELPKGRLHYSPAIQTSRSEAQAPVAQGIERRFPKPCVARSSRAGGTSSSDCGASRRRRGPGWRLSGSTSQCSSPTGICSHTPKNRPVDPTPSACKGWCRRRQGGVSCYSPTACVAVGYSDTSVTSDGGLSWTTSQQSSPVYTLDATTPTVAIRRRQPGIATASKLLSGQNVPSGFSQERAPARTGRLAALASHRVRPVDEVPARKNRRTPPR